MNTSVVCHTTREPIRYSLGPIFDLEAMSMIRNWTEGPYITLAFAQGDRWLDFLREELDNVKHLEKDWLCRQLGFSRIDLGTH